MGVNVPIQSKIPEFTDLDLKIEVVDKLPPKGQSGIIYMKPFMDKYEEWVWVITKYINGKETYDWQMLGTTTMDEESEEPEEIPTNCKNCGAPLENGKCNYCGAEYRLWLGGRK